MGRLHACAIATDGTLACWGSNTLGQLAGIPSGNGVPAGRFTAVASVRASDHSCAIKTDGTLVCWGNNHYGQLDGVPTDIAFTRPALSAGSTHSCAIKTGGSLACWGGTSGQSDHLDGGIGVDECFEDRGSVKNCES